MSASLLHAAWGLLRTTYAPSLLSSLNVDAHYMEDLPAPPFVLVSDHAAFLDPFVIGSQFERPIRYMANLEGVSPLRAAAAAAVGAYGRRKNAPDLGSLRRSLELVAGGAAIGIFPEGDRSWDGTFRLGRPGLGRFVRRLGVPLVLVRQKGNYLTMPRWAETRRRGTWSLRFSVLGADEIGRVADGFIDAYVTAALSKNEIKDAAAEGRRFSGKGVAEGVGRLLWRCPVCGKPDAIVGKGDGISCGRCGARWEMDANLRVRPRNVSLALHAFELGDLKDWYDWQSATLGELMDEGRLRGAALFSAGVGLARVEGRRVARLGSGELALRGGALVFEGPRTRLVFDPRKIHGFSDHFNRFSEFSHAGARWRLDFRGGNSLKWELALSSPRASGESGIGGKGAAA
ncbi:MAG: 1-acyl-sn-glycerol-3-phosphate acyltransferase [Rectinemataceae bacterium]